MSCEDFADALLDRDEPPHSTTAAVRAHAAQCERCALRLQRHEAVAGDLAALAGAVVVPVAALDAMEGRLMAAMDTAATNSPTVGVVTPTSRPWNRDWRAGAAAAVLVLAAAITWYPERPRPTPSAPKPAPAQTPREPAPRTSASAATPAPALTTTPSPATAPRRASTPARTAAPTLVASTPAAPGETSPAAPRTLSDADTRERLAAFVALPGATALPDFESGQIVRIAVPVANLPAYGLEVLPHASADAVSADVLIGQDGLARAIRLASFTTTTTTNGSKR